MADRALRGMQIGAKSLESEDGVVFADRFNVRYACPNGHEFEVTLSSEATAPATWECKCGQTAELIGETEEDEDNKPVKPQRTHWDMLLERRSIEELEVVLMGHGNHTDKYPEANGRYDRLAEYLQTRSPRFFVGTVDYGSLLFEHVAEQLAATCLPGCVINFLPLMSVAGDHAQNDMLGDYDPEEPLEEQSWRVRFSQLGYTIEDSNCHLKGLGDFASIRQIWIDHLVEAERQQHQH